MPSTLQRKSLLSILAILLSPIYIFLSLNSCKKTDSFAVNTDKEYSKFFNEHTSSSAVVQAVAGFVKRENDKYDFTDRIIQQMGYPHWKDAITVKMPGRKIITETTAKEEGNLSDVVFVPFVRENEQEVNAALRVTMSGTDTSFRFLQDWQYADTAATGMSSRGLAVLLMTLHNRVFADTLFKINDSSLFEVESGKRMKYISLNQPAITIEPQAQGLLIAYEYTMTVCYTGWEPLYQGQVVGCPPGPNCPHYRQVTICTSVSWIEWEDDGSGGGGGDPNPPGGGGPGGGWNPPDPCGGPSGIVSGRGNEPCDPDDPPGWEPLPIDDDPPTPKTPCASLKSLFNKPGLNAKSIINDSLKTFIQTHTAGEAGAAFKLTPTDSASFTMLPSTDTLAIDIPAGGNVYSAVHCHSNNGYPMFSWSDIYSLYLIWARKPNHISERASLLLTANDDNGVYQTYAILFEDLGTTLGAFFASPKNAGQLQNEIIANMNKDLERRYKKEFDNNTKNYERVFLRSIFGLNVSLYKANTDLTNWSKLSISNNSTTAVINTENCN